MSQNEKHILLISSESWGQNFISKHHYATYLSEENQVFFLEPAIGHAKFPLGDMEISTFAAGEHLNVISYRNLLPKLNFFPKFIQRWIYKLQAKRIQKHIAAKLDAVWSFDPFRFMDQKVWNADQNLYFIVDSHAEDSFEMEIMQTSDLVLTVSELLVQKFNPTAHKIHVVGHGADLKSFEKPQKEVVLLGKNKLKAGLTGNFNNNVDYGLIREAALSNPDMDFIFIGPYKSNNLGDTGDKTDLIQSLRKLDNVFFMGPVPSHELLRYLNAFDINLVLYKEACRGINSHKLMAYFYSGKPIVASWLLDYSDADPKLIAMARNNAGILELIADVKQNLPQWDSSENRRLRRNFAISNAYDSKIQFINSLLHGK